MKKIINVVILVLVTVVVSAQITIDLSKVFKAEGYAGILVGPKISVDTNKVSAFAALRLGANVYWTPTTWFMLNGIAAGEVNEKGGFTTIYLIGTRFILHERLAITVGKVATPMTEMRPVPTTNWGQFETWTSSQILPSAIGGKVTITINKESRIAAGAFWRGKDVSVELGAKVPHVHMGAYYQVVSRTFGGAIKASTKYVNTTVVYNHKGNFGFNASLLIPKTNGFMLYSDIGFNTNNNWTWIRGEWGILKLFTLKKVNALVGMGYAHDNKGVWGYLQVSL